MFGIRKEETPLYKVLETEDKFELREYQDFLIAKVKVRESFEKSGSKGFRPLANYIFGENQKKEKIQMTAPVGLHSASGQEYHNLSKENDWYISFFMPSRFEKNQLPKPDNADVVHEEIKGGLFAIIRYSGSADKKNFEKKLLDLKSWIKSKNFTQSESFWFWRYDPPWTLPILKRNEIAIRIQQN